LKYSKNEMIKMYRQMVKGRLYDDMMYNASMEGIVPMQHLGRGQEAVGSGVITALRDTDWFVATHRMHSAQLYRTDIKKFAAEHFNKSTGYNKGMACDYHLSSPELRLIFPNGILGQNIPIATGFAYALKMDKKDEIVVACEGDGAFTEGINYEALNLAAIYGLPLLAIVEDNGYSYSFPSNRYKKNLSERANALGVYGVTVDGNDILAVREAVDSAIARVRRNEPCLVECKTLRWDGHHTLDDASVYRDNSVIEEAKKNNDPIKRFEKVLFDHSLLTHDEKEKIREELLQQVNEAKEYAISCESPSAETLLDAHKIYVQPWEMIK
jgi:acetoin:2,6-dichlorophenolindophenol oxidoreductase subunit alpha